MFSDHSCCRLTSEAGAGEAVPVVAAVAVDRTWAGAAGVRHAAALLHIHLSGLRQAESPANTQTLQRHRHTMPSWTHDTVMVVSMMTRMWWRMCSHGRFDSCLFHYMTFMICASWRQQAVIQSLKCMLGNVQTERGNYVMLEKAACMLHIWWNRLLQTQQLLFLVCLKALCCSCV